MIENVLSIMSMIIMFIIIFGLLLIGMTLFALVVVFVYERFKNWKLGLACSILSGILIAPICIGICLSGFMYTESYPDESNGIAKEYKYELVNMADNRYYVVHRRDVNNSDVYDYLIKEGDYIKSYTAKRSNSVIVETDKAPKLIIREIEFKSKIRRFLNHNKTTTYVFHIPKGSVSQDFVIDLN